MLGQVKTENSSADDALMKLYRALAKRNAPHPGSFTSLDAGGRREYCRGRAREKEAAAAGALAATTANVRDALADAALMILATGSPGADQVRSVLGSIFSLRPGVPMTVETKARRGKLKPKLIGVN